MSGFRAVVWVALLSVSLVRCTVPSLEDVWRERGFCAVGDADCGMLRVRVDATGFVPGCLRFVATDDATETTLTASVPYRGTARQGMTLTQGFSPPKTWSLAVSVSVEAFEQTCDGPAVTTQRRQSTLREGGVSELAFALVASDADGDGYVSTATGGRDCDDGSAQVSPGATELCNEADDNCDGARDEGFDLGAACSSVEGCPGVKRCGGSSEVVCAAPAARLAWADEDADGHGDLGQGQVLVCSSTLPPNRLPLSAPHDDCDDQRAGIHPGRPDVCNGRDDNCSGDPDEAYSLGAACTRSGEPCPGTTQCNPADAGTRCVSSGPPVVWYRDEDADQFGRSDAGVTACFRPDGGFSSQAADCDDGNPFIHPTARELCDEQDNDCDGLSDEGTCTNGAPRWDVQTVEGWAGDWMDVATYADGGVWIVGMPSARAVKSPGSSAFSLLPGSLSPPEFRQPLSSVWAHPQTGAVYVGGLNGILLIHSSPSAPVLNARLVYDQGVTVALTGFVADGGVRLFGAADNTFNNHGLFEWDGGAGATPQPENYPGGAFLALHGLSPDLLFAVGPSVSRIRRYTPSSNEWIEDATFPVDVPALTHVRVVGPKLAFAVGREATLLRWDGSSWPSIPGPVGVTTEFVRVLAFGRNSVYLLTRAGDLYRYNGTSWKRYALGGLLYGLEGTSPEDIWVTGGSGRVFHYPSWPQ